MLKSIENFCDLIIKNIYKMNDDICFVSFRKQNN